MRNLPRFHSLRHLAHVAAWCLLGAISSLPAQQAPTTTPTAAQLAQYDSNHNGVLDPDERARLDTAQAKASTVVRSDETAAKGEVVAMSPFEVTADNDKGYLASSTMSGTRMNSKIEDLGASISVITRQQLVDTAAVDINDIFMYEANTEGTGQFTASSVNVNGLTTDDVQQSPQTANRVRGIGAANLSIGGFEANSRIPVDSYNLDSVEISRGANSNLMGLGDASGTVNLNQAQGNLTREITQLTSRGDTWGGFRSTVSLNRPLLKNVLAVRVDGLYDSRAFVRKPSGDLQRRQYIAVTNRPFKNTTIRGSLEFVSDKRQTPNAQTPRDTISYWLQNGRPTWDPITQTVHYPDGRSIVVGTNDALLPSGLGLDTTQYSRPSMYVDGGQIVLWTPNRNSTNGIPSNISGAARIIGTYTDVIRSRSTLYPLFTPLSVSNKNLYDWDKINFSATNWNQDKAATYNASIDQIFYRNPDQQLTGNVALRHEYSASYNRNLVRETSFLYLDINERLLDGRPNPFFLRPYVTVWEPTITRTSDNTDSYRAQLAYELDLRRKSKWLAWLGRERALAFYESRFTTTRNYASREGTLDPHSWNSQAAGFINSATGRASYKYYLGDNNGYNVDYAPPKSGTATAKYPFHYLSNPATGAFTDEMALFGETPLNGNGTGKNRSDRHTRGYNLQSFLLGDRLVETIGIREDSIRRRATPGVRLNADGFYHFEDIETGGWNAWSYASGRTKTYQTVVRPFRGWKPIEHWSEQSGPAGWLGQALHGLNFTYNTSQSFQPDTGTPKKNLLGQELTDPSGRNRDYGVLIDMFNSKLVARINWYKTEQKNARVSGGASTAVGRTAALDTGTSVFALYTWARNVVSARPAMAGASDDQIVAETYKLMQLPNGWFDQFNGFQMSDVNDVTARGTEYEININPSSSLRMKLTAARNETTDSNLSNATQAYIDMRLPAWTTIHDDAGTLWWTTTTANTWYANNIVPTLKLARANLGKPRSQIKKWTWNLTTNYTLGADRFTRGGPLGKLTGLSLGTAIHWADRSSIGFYGLADPDGIMRTYDINRPVYDPARTSYDFNVGYPLRFYHNRIRARIQLNGRDVFSHRGSLRAVAVNPDGTPANFRIVDGPQWILTTTFDL